jgi:hypothetical protein
MLERGDLAARKLHSLIFGLTLTATAFAFGGTAWADDWADCDQTLNHDRALRGYSNIITAGRESRIILRLHT